MKVLILGGDGFCGWATSLYLSDKGHDVFIVDNLSRRKIDSELGIESLTPIQDIDSRIAAWQELSGKSIKFQHIDVAQDYACLVSLISNYKPDAIVHFAEQRAAPYSMKSSREKRYTIDNNINATHNLLCAVVENGLDPHIVHLGTMGVYGYDGTDLDIPEGYLSVNIPNPKTGNSYQKEILHPTDPGSIYHMTKSMDQLIFKFYAKNDALRITDLHQGIVWGTQTEQTERDERLINRFDYDGDYGTVLNRFIMQAAVKHPLTVHGTGGQTRAFINIRDCVRCIELAISNPPSTNEQVKIFNQTTETFSVIGLATMISEQFDIEIHHLENPRNEKVENKLNVKCSGLKELGLEPTLLKDSLLKEVYDIAHKYSDRCQRNKILCTSYWQQKRKAPTTA